MNAAPTEALSREGKVGPAGLWHPWQRCAAPGPHASARVTAPAPAGQDGLAPPRTAPEASPAPRTAGGGGSAPRALHRSHPPCCSRGRSAARSPGCSTAATWPRHLLPRRPGEPSSLEHGGRKREGRKEAGQQHRGRGSSRGGKSRSEPSGIFTKLRGRRERAGGRAGAADGRPNGRAAAPGSGAGMLGPGRASGTVLVFYFLNSFFYFSFLACEFDLKLMLVCIYCVAVLSALKQKPTVENTHLCSLSSLKVCLAAPGSWPSYIRLYVLCIIGAVLKIIE